MVNQLISAGIGFGVLAVGLMIVAGLISTTYTTVNATSPSLLLNTTNTNVGTAINTFTGLIPVVALAIVGGMAIFYVLSFMGGRVR